jgi:hypothetical protein
VIVIGIVAVGVLDEPLLPLPLPDEELLVWATGLTFVILPSTVLPSGSWTVTGSPTTASLCLVASRLTVTTSWVEVVERIAVAADPPLDPEPDPPEPEPDPPEPEPPEPEPEPPEPEPDPPEPEPPEPEPDETLAAPAPPLPECPPPPVPVLPGEPPAVFPAAPVPEDAVLCNSSVSALSNAISADSVWELLAVVFPLPVLFLPVPLLQFVPVGV